MTNNLVEPLKMNMHDSLIFCRDHVCLDCQDTGILQPLRIDYDEFYIHCTNCKQDMREGDTLTRTQKDKANVNQKIGEWELRKGRHQK